LVPSGKTRVNGIATIGDFSVSGDSEAMLGCITGFYKDGSGVKGGKKFLDTNTEVTDITIVDQVVTFVVVGNEVGRYLDLDYQLDFVLDGIDYLQIRHRRLE